MSTTSTKGTPSYIKWGAGILLVLAFAFAWYVIAEQSDSEKAEATQTEAVVDSVTTTTSQAAATVSNKADSVLGEKVGDFLDNAAQAESVAPVEPNNE